MKQMKNDILSHVEMTFSDIMSCNYLQKVKTILLIKMIYQEPSKNYFMTVIMF